MANGVNTELEKKYTRLNNILGWLVFLVAICVYYSTVESSNSFWDCSENLSIYYKLEVGHSPGEPFLQLVQHIVSLLSFGDVHRVAPVMNHMASTFSAMAILFLFWTITYFGRRLADKTGGLTEGNMYAVLGSGLVGAGGFIFADSLWFSSIEASVWAGAMGFTALMFWCVTKWERSISRPENWIILIFFLVGLSIGVHLLCLLFIPAAVFVYYYKTHPDGLHNRYSNMLLGWFTKDPKKQGVLVALISAVVILYLIKNIIVPGIVDVGFWFELFFVNAIGLPFNSGIVIYGIALLAAIVWGINYTIKRNKPGWNTAILSFAGLLLGYSCYFIIVVRAAADTPMNEGNPSNPISLHSYLGREQYGDWPVLYGQYYTAPMISTKDGAKVYAKDPKQHKYVVSYTQQIPVYDPKFCGIFPRMWEPDKAPGYKSWGGTDFEKIPYTDESGKSEMKEKPTFGDNIHYFLHYQVYFMYIRYFLWDFVGRQNDIQGMDPPDNLHGNWITGIPFLDAVIGPPQDNMPDELAKNKARAPMYALPLILGILGFAFQYKKDSRDLLTIGVFFFFSGLMIVFYLNQWAQQPRERDYSYVISFYAFAIWMGLGVMNIYSFLAKRMANMNPKTASFAAIALSLIVPVVMAKAEWPAHDRSHHYVAHDTAVDYLESCAPNAILFTNGDNDTFPLWYAQEVEGIRTDVRVCNLELLGMGWYADMMNRKTYNGERLPFSMTHDQYKDGTRDYLYHIDRGLKGYTDLAQVIDFIKSDNTSDQYPLQDGSGRSINYFPTMMFSLKVNKDNVLKSGAIPANMKDSVVSEIDWTMPGSVVQRSQIMMLDMLAHNDWKRPVYFAVSLPSYYGLDKYLQLEGMAYRLVPLKSAGINSQDGPMVNTALMFDNIMHKFRWGNMGSGIYIDDTFRRTIGGDLRAQCSLLAQALIKENKDDSARKVLDLCADSIPEATVPYDYFSFEMCQLYYAARATQKAEPMAKRLFDTFESSLKYLHSLDRENLMYYGREVQECEAIMERLQYLAQMNGENDLSKNFKDRIDGLQKTGVFQQMQ
jgi:hypothetical protein